MFLFNMLLAVAGAGAAGLAMLIGAPAELLSLPVLLLGFTVFTVGWSFSAILHAPTTKHTEE